MFSQASVARNAKRSLAATLVLLLPLDSREEQEQAGAVPERQSDKSKVFPRSFLISL